MIIAEEDPVHVFFELSYAEYLAIPRSVLQSMPVEWQRDFVHCLEELDKAIDWRSDHPNLYRVSLWATGDVWDEDGERFIEDWTHEVDDPLLNYERGRRKLPLKETAIKYTKLAKRGTMTTRPEFPIQPEDDE